jgi:hypothetical protein
MRTAIREGFQLDQYARRCDGSGAVPPMDAEAIGAHPFKRLLLPFDSYPKFREPQVLAGVFSDHVVRATYPWKPGISVEPVRVGHERPQPLRGRAEAPLPLVMKLRVAHRGLLLS